MKGAAFLQVPSQNSMLYSWDMEVTPTPEQEAFIRDAIAARRLHRPSAEPRRRPPNSQLMLNGAAWPASPPSRTSADERVSSFA
jgi:hypothetical protein